MSKDFASMNFVNELFTRGLNNLHSRFQNYRCVLLYEFERKDEREKGEEIEEGVES